MRDASGRRPFLLVAAKDRSVDLKALRPLLGSSTLRGRLGRLLGLEKGVVTLIGVQRRGPGRGSHLRRGVADEAVLGVHPVENTATVFLAFADLEAFIRDHGNSVILVRF